MSLTTVLAAGSNSHHRSSALGYCSSLQICIRNFWSLPAHAQSGENRSVWLETRCVTVCTWIAARWYASRRWQMTRSTSDVPLQHRPRRTQRPYPECMTCLSNCLLTPPQLTLCVCAVRKL